MGIKDPSILVDRYISTSYDKVKIVADDISSVVTVATNVVALTTVNTNTTALLAVDAATAEKNATRINQLSLMIADYARTDTSKFNVKTEALAKIWQDPEHFSKDIDKLTVASAALMVAAQSKDEGAIKKAIGGVGKTCGGCHDHFKEE
jgi:cytochrome c556